MEVRRLTAPLEHIAGKGMVVDNWQLLSQFGIRSARWYSNLIPQDVQSVLRRKSVFSSICMRDPIL